MVIKNTPKKNLGSKTGILSFKIETTRLDCNRVLQVFDQAGFKDYAPACPNDATAFLAAIAMMHTKGDNPKRHGTKNPLIPGHRVFFKKVKQGEGKKEIVCNVNVLPADQRGADAPCKQVIVFNNGSATFVKPSNLDHSEYNPDLMKQEFLAAYDDCRKIDSEMVRVSIHKILPKARPYWINGRIVCFYEASQHELVLKVTQILNDLGNVTMATLLDITNDNKGNLAEAFVRSIGDNVKSGLKDIQTSLNADKDIKEKTVENFGKQLDTLKMTVGYYQNLLGVANEAIADYVNDIAKVEKSLFEKLTGKPMDVSMDEVKPIESVASVDAEDPFAQIS